MSKIDIEGMPPAELLESVVPLPLWYKAMSRAASCAHRRHRTGCLIIDGNNNIVTAGVAHPTEGDYAVRSIHAERDALRKLGKRKGEVSNYAIMIVTLTRVGNFATASRPCTHCAQAISDSGIGNVVYAERTNDGSWAVRNERPWNLLSQPLMQTRFA